MWLKRKLGDSIHAYIDLEASIKCHQHRFGSEMAVPLVPAGTTIPSGYKYGIYVVFSSTSKLLEAVQRLRSFGRGRPFCASPFLGP